MYFYRALKQLDKNKENIVLTIITGVRSSSKLLLSDGEMVYTNNDSIDWEKIVKFIPENKRSQVIDIGGERIYVEFMMQQCRLVVCGAGHISMSIIKMCSFLEIPVTVIDDRLLFANNARQQGADNVICEPFEKALGKIEGDEGTFFVIVTRGHRYDQVCLEHIIKKKNAYIGMIGSRLRVGKVLSSLEERGVPAEKLREVHTPIGLKIGAETPAEIAVSIMAEIIEVKNKKSGGSSYPEEVIEGILNEKFANVPKALVTIASRKGSAPRDVGTKMLVLRDGSMLGTIGGGCVESQLRQDALTCIDNQESKLLKVDMTGLAAEDEGMVCGGILELFVEPIK